jgi:hypothetical protein
MEKITKWIIGIALVFLLIIIGGIIYLSSISESNDKLGPSCDKFCDMAGYGKFIGSRNQTKVEGGNLCICERGDVPFNNIVNESQ